MAARRLLIVMLILLGISTAAAAFIPTDRRGDETTEGTETEATDSIPDRLPAGELLKPERIDVGGDTLPVVRVELGDQLELRVHSKRTDLLEIPAVGIVEPVSPERPAVIRFLARESGSYGIRMVEADRVVARIEVARPAKEDRKSEGD